MRTSLSWAGLVALVVTASACSGCGSSTTTTGAGAGGGDGGLLGDGPGDPGDGGTDPDGGGPLGPPCGSADVTKGFAGAQTITVGGAARTYELYVPEAYDVRKTYPLVFVLHGDGGTGAGIRGSFKLEAESAGGAIFVYPDGLGKTWSIDSASTLGRDVAFIDAVADSLQKSHCVDAKRIFATGFSKGAYFTNMLGCLAKTPLRGVIGHAGGGPFGVDGSGTTFDSGGQLVCPRPPVAALQVQGENDGAVPLSEGQKARDHWRRVNGCAATTKAYDPSPCVTYDGCAAGRSETWCQIPGMGHTIWANGAKVTWEFVQR